MDVFRLRIALLGAAVVATAVTLGCGGQDTNTSSTRGTGSSSSGAGGAGGGGEGGAGGQGGQGGVADHGSPATETVTAGDVSKSANYKMVFTFGQPTQNQGKTTSPSYGMQGGLIGATGSAK